jgi:hypothetical protein
MVAVSLFVLSPIRFEYMVSVLGLGYLDALARIMAGNIVCSAARFASMLLHRLLFPDTPPSAASRADARSKLKAA